MLVASPSSVESPRILDRFAKETPYIAERPPQPIDLWLDLNEASEPADGALESLRSLEPDALRRYPDAGALESAFASLVDVDPSRVLATAGGDDAIDRVCRVMLDESRTLVTHAPVFSMIERSALRTGARVETIAWERGEFPIDEFLSRVDERTGVAALVSPNNPTGLVINRTSIERAARRCATVGASLLLDLAYIEFADDDVTAFALTLPNTVIVRTLSKAYGLAGLRVGVLLGDQRVVDACRSVGGPFAISGPSIAIASEVLSSSDPTPARPAQVRTERGRLAEFLRARDAEVLDSQANFVLARFASPSLALFVRDALRGLGVSVRAWPTSGALENALRITCPGDARAFDRLVDALDAAIAPEALLLDLDGVLADVSRSYRTAIIATCETFGVSVTPGEIATLKARGGANNDWRVTRELLAMRGIDLPLAEITERFEAIYQGSDGRPGLRETESLLETVETIRSLATRLPVAIVTGRPRADAMRFLDRFGLLAHTRELICMEDGPSKPDPAIVRIALERLGVRRAWMVGDTVDDVRAARKAGAVPIGVIAPQDDRAFTTETLLRAGAARIIDSLNDLQEFLP